MAFLTNLTAGTQSGGRISDLMVYETNRTGPNDYACVQFLPRRSCTSAALAIDGGGGLFLNWKPIMRMILLLSRITGLWNGSCGGWGRWFTHDEMRWGAWSQSCCRGQARRRQQTAKLGGFVRHVVFQYLYFRYDDYY